MSKFAKQDSSGGSKYGQVTRPEGATHGVDALEEVASELFLEAVVAVLRIGDAILLGTTRDGGAVSIQLLYGDETEKLYGASAVELEVLLSGVRDVARAQ